jgi:hypothetical protein
MLNILINFLFASGILYFMLAFYTFFLPILLVNFRPGWLMVLLGASCFSSGFVFESYIQCYRDKLLCSDEVVQEWGNGMLIIFLIGGLIYSTTFLVIQSVVRKVVQKIFSRRF